MTFTIDEMNLVLRGLGELPAKESLLLIQTIHAEYNKQRPPAGPKQRLQEVPQVENPSV
jgi:hypothetical protein